MNGLNWIFMSWIFMSWIFMSWIFFSWIFVIWIFMSWLFMSWIFFSWIFVIWIFMSWLFMSWIFMSWIFMSWIIYSRCYSPNLIQSTFKPLLRSFIPSSCECSLGDVWDRDVSSLVHVGDILLVGYGSSWGQQPPWSTAHTSDSLAMLQYRLDYVQVYSYFDF